jgi:hypothetical protein
LGTWRVIEESQTPGCPGSKKTDIPAMFAAVAVPTVTAVPAVTLRTSALATTRATAARSKRRWGTAKA